MNAGFVLLLLVVGLVNGASDEHVNGRPGCPCLDISDVNSSFPVEFTTPANCLNYFYGGNTYCFPSTYGSSECKAHDDGLDPYCNTFGFPGNPNWCEQKWCWVDKNNCDEPFYKSSFFDELDLHYSYRTCGGINSFSSWFEPGTLSNDFTDLIGLVESYVISTKSAIENTFADIEAAIDSNSLNLAECHNTDACNCPNCKYSDDWKAAIDTEAVNMVYHQVKRNNLPVDDLNQFKCVSTGIESTYLQNAAREYHDDTRIAYQYYGDQVAGGMLQWPASDFCSTEFDPRFRPWYSSAVSGPKDIVIAVDVSGSMLGSRIALAQEAVKAVLKTVTWADYVTIITFNSVVNKVYSSNLEPATEENVGKMNAWAKTNLVANGGTNFDAPLAMAYQILQRSRNSDGRTSCSQLILFLTDGDAALDTGALENMANNSPDVTIFSYGLGSGAQTSKLNTMACKTGGLFYQINNEAILPTVMAQYYEYFGTLQDDCKLSWVKYSDALTGAELIAGCTAIYNYTETPRQVIGVTCFDLNVIVRLEVLATCNGGAAYPQFLNLIGTESKRCSAKGGKVTDECELARLRSKIGPSAACPSPSPLQCNSSSTPSSNSSSCDNLSPERFTSIEIGQCDFSARSFGGDDEDGNTALIVALSAVGALVAVIAAAAVYRFKFAKESSGNGSPVTSGAPASSSATLATNPSSQPVASAEPTTSMHESNLPTAVIVHDENGTAISAKSQV